MLKRILFLMALCLAMLPLSASFAFVQSPESKNVAEGTCGWDIEIIRQDGDKKDTLLSCSLKKGRDTIKQEDDTLVFHNDYFTIIETSKKNEDIVFKVHDAAIDGNLYSEEFTLNKEDNEFVLPTKYDGISIKLAKHLKTDYKGGFLY